MRRKSERTSSKKKASPEKKEKVEKSKRTRTSRRNRKNSSSSDSEPEDKTPKEIGEVGETENTNVSKPAKEESPEESQEQVWQVKPTEGSGDVGEIQKLKICLARPPSTPERADRSPRSKRKHSRATSSSDTQSVEGEEKKKTKHRSKRSSESKEKDKSDSHKDNEDAEDQSDVQIQAPSESKPESTETTTEVGSGGESTKTDKPATDETPMSTTNEESKDENVSTENKESEGNNKSESKEQNTESQEKAPDADTTFVDTTLVIDTDPKPQVDDANASSDNRTPERKRSLSAEKSEILELHPEESRCESTEISLNESQETESRKTSEDEKKDGSTGVSGEVSINESSTEITGKTGSSNENTVTNNKNDVVESTKTVESEKESTESKKEESTKESKQESTNESDHTDDNKQVENKQNSQDVSNGQVTQVINRKRRWGSRPNRLSTQKSITISTDVLKEIIPDVKPVEFDEVIEEKKHKRIEVPERIDRPVLPKIVIDNTEHIEMNNKDQKSEDRDKENIKSKESNIGSSRKISIVKDNDSIITRPPSPPRHKQSNILYITNLVRPFTLPQLKNLLQRTGRIVENEFWIDRIKSKCFVKYENEDQAVETRHALHGVTWPVSNPKTLHVDFSTQEDFDKAKTNEVSDNAKQSTIPGTVEDWLREQDIKREKGELEKPWERKASMREWDVGKNEKGKEVARQDTKVRDDRPVDKRRHRTPERSPEPARKFKKKEEEAPAKLLDDLFKKTKTTPCIYWLPLSAETIAVKEEQRRQHMAEHERRLQELRRTHRRH